VQAPQSQARASVAAVLPADETKSSSPGQRTSRGRAFQARAVEMAHGPAGWLLRHLSCDGKRDHSKVWASRSRTNLDELVPDNVAARPAGIVGRGAGPASPPGQLLGPRGHAWSRQMRKTTCPNRSCRPRCGPAAPAAQSEGAFPGSRPAHAATQAASEAGPGGASPVLGGRPIAGVGGQGLLEVRPRLPGNRLMWAVSDGRPRVPFRVAVGAAWLTKPARFKRVLAHEPAGARAGGWWPAVGPVKVDEPGNSADSVIPNDTKPSPPRFTVCRTRDVVRICLNAVAFCASIRAQMPPRLMPGVGGWLRVEAGFPGAGGFS